MKFFVMLTMLAISAVSFAQSAAPADTVTPAGSIHSDSEGSMNTTPEAVKNIDTSDTNTRTHQQKMEDEANRGLDSAQTVEPSATESTDMNTVPAQTPSSTNP